MSILSELRSLIFLRRIARAQERLANATEELASIERERWAKEAHLRVGKVKPTEFASFDADAANELWRKEREAAEYGGIVEEESK